MGYGSGLLKAQKTLKPVRVEKSLTRLKLADGFETRTQVSEGEWVAEPVSPC